MKIIKNAWNKLMKNTAKRWKVIKRDHLVREYFKHNVLFLTFLVI